MSSTDAAGRPSSDPERSSSRRLGNGLIIRAQRFDSSRVLQYTTFARLAQLAERRSLKSEARGSSPRSCTNSLDLRRLCEADPLSMVARSTFRQHELLAVAIARPPKRKYSSGILKLEPPCITIYEIPCRA
jgi:hypothetical protein